MADIDIGAAAIDRGDCTSVTFTRVGEGNSANDTGSIASVEIFACSEMLDCEVATFFVVSGDNLSTRDSEALGTVTSGSKQTFSGLDMDVQTGDYIGICGTAGSIKYDKSGGVGYFYRSGDNIPCTDEVFTHSSGKAISLYGEGETAAVAEGGANYIRMNPLSINIIRAGGI